MTPLAVLRPEPGNAATAARVEAQGLRAIRLPLFEIRAVPWIAPDPAGFDALLLASANAVQFGGAQLEALRDLPVLAVGARTAAAARGAGFDVMVQGDADAADLLERAKARGVQRALHLGGRERGIEAGGPVALALTVYASEAVPIAPADIGRLAGTTALLHSARAAHRLAELVDARRVGIGIAAFSAGVAAAAGTGWAWTAIAAAPSDAALIAAARARD